MSFDFYAQQQQILDRLAPVAGGIGIADTFSIVDLTEQGAAVVAAQLVFESFNPEGQAGTSARHNVRWCFDVYVDNARAEAADKTAAADLFSNALAQLVGWEITAGRYVRTAEGRDSGFDGRILRLSFGFNVPVFITG